ncbi:hypothetical protein PCIT_a0945 [Pseudoalteromonas citrea]|uniref:Uncharacterized protein n=1 Tax=Pseudoalteromonas citrea TaxID=43655 RepID=A0AAD4FTC7_9GAMM|nr:hypothetical protein PCIT_a0945 [Pseudoalteromonas citrea]
MYQVLPKVRFQIQQRPEPSGASHLKQNCVAKGLTWLRALQPN